MKTLALTVALTAPAAAIAQLTPAQIVDVVNVINTQIILAPVHEAAGMAQGDPDDFYGTYQLVNMPLRRDQDGNCPMGVLPIVEAYVATFRNENAAGAKTYHHTSSNVIHIANHYSIVSTVTGVEIDDFFIDLTNVLDARVNCQNSYQLTNGVAGETTVIRHSDPLCAINPASYILITAEHAPSNTSAWTFSIDSVCLVELSPSRLSTGVRYKLRQRGSPTPYATCDKPYSELQYLARSAVVSDCHGLWDHMDEARRLLAEQETWLERNVDGGWRDPSPGGTDGFPQTPPGDGGGWQEPPEPPPNTNGGWGG